MKKNLLTILAFLALTSCEKEIVQPKPDSLNHLVKTTSSTFLSHALDGTLESYNQELSRILEVSDEHTRIKLLAIHLGFSSDKEFISSVSSLANEVENVRRLNPDFDKLKATEQLRLLNYEGTKFEIRNYSTAELARVQVGGLAGCLDAAESGYAAALTNCAITSYLCGGLYPTCWSTCIGSAGLVYGSRQIACFIAFE